jgi:drug/metabolite transporter (DMT)-like permease
VAETPTRAEAARGTLFVALGACGFGTISILVTLATGAGAPLLAVLFWRYALAVPVLVGGAAAARALRLDSRALKTMALAGLGQTLIAVITLSALRYISAATLAFLFYTFPAWVAVIARLRHSEPLTPPRLIALVLSLLGIGVMVGAPDTALHPMGVTLALVGAVIYAAYIPMLGALQERSGPLATTAWMSVGASFLLGVLAVSRGELTAAMHGNAWIAIVALALVSTAGAFFIFMKGLRILGSVRTAIVSTIEPFFTALLGASVLSQPLTRGTLAGGALIATAVVLLQLRTGGNSDVVPPELSD